MTLPIGHAVPVAVTGPGTGSLATGPHPSGTATASAAGGLTVVDASAATSAMLASAWTALTLNLKLGTDARDVGMALVPTMQSLIAQRPDLANADFDFSSSNGSIVVTSNALSDSDKTWLQNLLNGNDALASAIQTFHDDAMASYAAATAPSSTPPTPDQLDAASDKANVDFMKLFRQMGSDARLGGDDMVDMQDDSRIDMSRDPGNAAGLLAFMQGAQALAAGTVKQVFPDAAPFYGTQIDIFADWNALPHFFPPDTSSLGVHLTA